MRLRVWGATMLEACIIRVAHTAKALSGVLCCVARGAF